MTNVLATVRPDSWNFPLFVHVFGAMILVGGLLTATSAIAYARGDARSLRLGYWTLLAVALPGWIIMFAGANWIWSREGWDDVSEENTPTWLGIGWLTATSGGLVLLVSLIVGGIGMYRLRAGKGTRLLTATMILSLVLLVAYVVAVWAMAGKPD
jgi:hypothetical protein